MATKGTEGSEFPNPRILVIDGDPQMLNVLAIVLRNAGFDMAKASTGKDALRSLEKDHFGLVLADLDLQDITGLELCHRIKEVEGRRDVPVILMSGRLEEEGAEMALRTCASDFISKPFRTEDLLAKVFTHIVRR